MKYTKYSFYRCYRDFYSDKFGHFPEEARLEMVKKAKEMFTFGYDSYMKFAFPMDELDPIHCKGKSLELFAHHKWQIKKE